MRRSIKANKKRKADESEEHEEELVPFLDEERANKLFNPPRERKKNKPAKEEL